MEPRLNSEKVQKFNAQFLSINNNKIITKIYQKNWLSILRLVQLRIDEDFIEITYSARHCSKNQLITQIQPNSSCHPVKTLHNNRSILLAKYDQK